MLTLNLACIQKGFVPNKDFHIGRATNTINGTVYPALQELYNFKLGEEEAGHTEEEGEEAGHTEEEGEEEAGHIEEEGEDGNN